MSDEADQRQEVHDLMNKLSGPIFGLRMASGLMRAPESFGLTAPEQARRRAATTRFNRAARQIDQLVREYVRANPTPLEDPK